MDAKQQIRYVFKHEKTGVIIKHEFSIFQVECAYDGFNKQVRQKLDENFILIGRDLHSNLNDKNGNLIFENDLFKFKNEIQVVQFVDGEFRMGDYPISNVKYGRVLGTTYENPEL
ncbi:hypothetical protein OCA22_28715 [Bacillus cereus]|nr:hypothetical protein [Bacillus cereus]